MKSATRKANKGFELSSSKSVPEAHARGAYAEKRVCEYFLDQGYRIRAHQKKIFGVEYDWIFERNDGAVYVEVKSVRSADFYVQRWPWRQKQRFIRVAAILAEREKAIFFLALVDYKDKVHLFRVGSEI